MFATIFFTFETTRFALFKSGVGVLLGPQNLYIFSETMDGELAKERLRQLQDKIKELHILLAEARSRHDRNQQIMILNLIDNYNTEAQVIIKSNIPQYYKDY